MRMYTKAYKLAEELLKLSIRQIRQKYNVIGEGTARIVVEYSPTIAIKVAKGEKGRIQNEVENEIFHTAPRELKPYLARIYEQVIEGDGALIVRKYPKKVKKLYAKKNVTEYQKIRKIMRINEFYIGDNDRSSSYRTKKNGSLIMVDYGFNKRTQQAYWSNK